MGRRGRAMVEPLRIHRNTHIFQLVEKENAPAEGQAGAGRWRRWVRCFGYISIMQKSCPVISLTKERAVAHP